MRFPVVVLRVMHSFFLVIMLVLNLLVPIIRMPVTSVHHAHASEDHHPQTHYDYDDTGNNFASLITRIVPFHSRLPIHAHVPSFSTFSIIWFISFIRPCIFFIIAASILPCAMCSMCADISFMAPDISSIIFDMSCIFVWSMAP